MSLNIHTLYLILKSFSLKHLVLGMFYSWEIHRYAHKIWVEKSQILDD